MKSLASDATATKSRIEALCRASALKLTGHRRLIIAVISEARDHPDFPELYRRIAERNPRISRATVARTLKLLTSERIIERRLFRDRRYHYKPASDAHHDHLIDMKTGKVCEFSDPKIERLQKEIALKLGYELTGHRLELYAVPLSRLASKKSKTSGRTSLESPVRGRDNRHRWPDSHPILKK